MSGTRDALIVGAGIGGFAMGLALRRAGWRVRIFERTATPREPGFALSLAPNAALRSARSVSPTPSWRGRRLRVRWTCVVNTADH